MLHEKLHTHIHTHTHTHTHTHIHTHCRQNIERQPNWSFMRRAAKLMLCEQNQSLIIILPITKLASQRKKNPTTAHAQRQSIDREYSDDGKEYIFRTAKQRLHFMTVQNREKKISNIFVTF